MARLVALCLWGLAALVSASPPPPPPPAAQSTSESPAAIAAAKASAAQLASAHPQFPDVTPLPPGRHRVCVFDFDDTLKNEGNVVANDAFWVVHACVAQGYDIAIASAGCKTDFVKSFLFRRVAPDVFNDAFFNSPAFQMCQPIKTQSLTAILNYFQLDGARRCAILFDNSKYNKPFADAVGAGFQFVDNGSLEGKVGEPGIRASDFFAAQSQWATSCPMAGAPPRLLTMPFRGA